MIVKFEDISLVNVKGVLLNLDDTLYDYWYNHNKAIEACILLCNQKISFSVELFNENFKNAREQINLSLHETAYSRSRLLYFQRMYELIFGKTSAIFSLEMEETYWNTFLENMKLYEASKSFLEKIKKLSIPSCIVIDLTTQIQMKKLIKLGLDSYINYLVTSEEAGVEKPDSKIFELALIHISLKNKLDTIIGKAEIYTLN